MVVIIHPSHLIQICVFMSGERTKVAASSMPHAQPWVISSQHFLSLIISSLAVNVWVEGRGQNHTLPRDVCVTFLNTSFQELQTNAI